MLKNEQIKRILIIGCGTLGLRIGLRCAMDGYQVTMYDISDGILANALEVQHKLLRSFVKRDLLDANLVDGIKGRIRCSTEPADACKDVDLVSESVTEEIDIKRRVYTEFAPHWPSHAVITTNTSYLLPSSIADVSGCPERFCAFHFHDVFVANVVDVMPHEGTAPWVCDLLMEFGKSIHQIPVFIQKENSGYVYNTMLMALIGAAGALLTGEVASVEDIDRSWMGNMKQNIGLFGMLDQIGLDTAWHIVKERKDAKSIRFASVLKSYVDAGKLGIKSGEGFYKYPNPAYLGFEH